MRLTTNRRTALGALLGTAALAPAAAAAPATDAELIRLGAEWDRLTERHDVVTEEIERRYERCRAERGEKPEALRKRPGDWLTSLFREDTDTHYCLGDVVRFRRLLDADGVLNTDFKARAHEVIAAHDARVHHWNALVSRYRIEALEARQNTIDDKRVRLENQVFAVRAHTLAGLAVKARIARIYDDPEPETGCDGYADAARSIMADLLAGRS